MQLEQTVKGGEGHNEYWPLGQGPVEARPPIGIGGKSPFPYTTVHADPHRRFRKVELTRGALASGRTCTAYQKKPAPDPRGGHSRHGISVRAAPRPPPVRAR